MNEDIFELTEDHLKLLRRMYVYFEDSGYDGAPAINLKRPYGNSDVPFDVAEILGWTPEGLYDGDEDDLSERQVTKALEIHRGTGTALQIVLVTGKFEVGTYEKSHYFDSTSWVKIK